MKKESSVARGARYELICCLDLLRQGFTVYRNVAAAGSSDLLGLKRGQVVKVQVKSEVGRHGIRRNDVLAVVSPQGILRYRARCRRVARLFEECRVIRRVAPSRGRRLV